MLEEFKSFYPNIKVKVIIADALYFTAKFMHQASSIFGFCSSHKPITKTRNIFFRNKWQSISAYFASHSGVYQQIKVRGGEVITAQVSSARLYVKAHKQKLFIIAIKYEGELEYRYLVANDLSWLPYDIVRAYTLRWDVPVFFDPLQLYEGWGLPYKQLCSEGSNRSLILSLLLDHCQNRYPVKTSLAMKTINPLLSLSSLLEKIKVESLLLFIQELLTSNNPQAELERLSSAVKEVFQLNPSKKHMNNRDLGRLEATPSLKHKAQ